MSTFSPQWLALREPADSAARSSDIESWLADALARGRARARVLEVVDLGAGTGANLRHLAPRLGGQQAWRLVDHDHAVLAAVERSLRGWAPAHGLAATRGERLPIRLSGGGLDCEAAATAADLAAGLDALAVPRGGLVTGSALLDLVSSDWLDALAARCAAAGAYVLFALTYDGRIALEPHEAADDKVRTLVNRHQRTDKGFGPALGPDAFRTALAAFRRHGYTMRSAASDWHIGPDQPALQRALLDGWHAAAAELSSAERGVLRAWHRRRIALVAEGRSRITVGHVDIAGYA